jgi:xanthine dehydrogenase accessory factor
VPDWIEAIRAAREKVALVTLLSTEGSAPRAAGTRMAVTAEEVAGTIGGGALEHQAIAQARAILAQRPGSWRVQDWPLGPMLGQCCGGRVRLLVEQLDPQDLDWIDSVERREPVAARFGRDRIQRFPAGQGEIGTRLPEPPRAPVPAEGTTVIEPDDRLAERPLLMFGAGHVGFAVAQRLAGLPFRLAWFDPREERAIPGVSLQSEDDMVACAAEAGAGSAVVIFTHDHGLDYRLTVAALKSQAGFVGLIGSMTKRARFLSRLAAEGVDADRLTCPIGIERVAGKQPDVIAISVIAQLLALGGPA